MNNNPPFKQMYYLQRPLSPKNTNQHTHSTKNLSLTMSIGANQNSVNFLPFSKNKTDQTNTNTIDVTSAQIDRYERLQSELKNISKQNTFLREENQNLKRQLIKTKKQMSIENARSNQKYSSTSPNPYNDLRGTIKKQVGQMKEVKLKLQMLSKQCKIYQQIIDKMDDRIKKLTHDNSKKNSQIDQLKSELSKFDTLKEKVNTVMGLYNDLQSKFNSQQVQWMKWKQNWLSQKEYYIDKIRQLQKNLDKNYKER